MPLSSVLREPYASQVPGFFDGLRDGKAIAAALPARPREMFREHFLADLDAGRETWLLQRLAENGLHDWSPKAPIRLYYGSPDLEVSPQESITQAERLRARGGEVRAINVGDFDHDGSVLAAISDLRAWFDELAKRQ